MHTHACSHVHKQLTGMMTRELNNEGVMVITEKLSFSEGVDDTRDVVQQIRVSTEIASIVPRLLLSDWEQSILLFSSQSVLSFPVRGKPRHKPSIEIQQCNLRIENGVHQSIVHIYMYTVYVG